jgi:antitoxin ParD1/3/4
MSDHEQPNIDLAPDMADALRAVAAEGGFGSLDALVVEALGEWLLWRESPGPGADALRAMVQDGIDSGPGLDTDLVFGPLRARSPVP